MKDKNITISLNEYKELLLKERPSDNDKWLLEKIKGFIAQNCKLDRDCNGITIYDSYDFARNILNFIKMIDMAFYKSIVKKCYDNEMEKEERNDNMNITLNPIGLEIKYKKESKLPDKVQFNKKKKATTLIFDDDVVVVKQNENDKEDYEKAFLWAYFIKKSGLSKTQASKYIDKVMEDLKWKK